MCFDSSMDNTTKSTSLEFQELRRQLKNCADIKGHAKTSLAHGCTGVPSEIRKVKLLSLLNSDTGHRKFESP